MSTRRGDSAIIRKATANLFISASATKEELPEVCNTFHCEANEDLFTFYYDFFCIVDKNIFSKEVFNVK